MTAGQAAAEAAEYAGIMAGALIAGIGYMWLCLEGIPALADAARMGWRIARVVFLAVGWVAAIGRLIL